MQERNFPSRHPLNGGGRAACGSADVILGLAGRRSLGHGQHLPRPAGAVLPVAHQAGREGAEHQHRRRRLHAKATTRISSATSRVDLAIAADAEATLPSLIEAIKRLLTADRSGAIRRTRKDAGGGAAERPRAGAQSRRRTGGTPARSAWRVWRPRCGRRSRTRTGRSAGRADSPASVGLRQVLSDDHVGGAGRRRHRLTAPPSVGAALAHRKHGRLCVCIQTDGDLMYAPGALWTAAHHRIPMLSVMHNNRAYHQEVMHIQRMANRRQRGILTARASGRRSRIRTSTTPSWRRAWACTRKGRSPNPNDLGPAIQRAIAVVKRGEPALVDVVTQAR